LPQSGSRGRWLNQSAMRPWRVTVVDGLFRRYEGFGIVLASSADEARQTTTEYLSRQTAYGKPFEVSEVEPHDHPEPHVAFYSWGRLEGWPQKYETDDLEPLPDDVPEEVGPRRFVAPDGQAFFGHRRGRLLVFWPESDEDDRYEAYWDDRDQFYALVPIASTLGYMLGKDEYPMWLRDLEVAVTRDLEGFEGSE
jgi:hypothetical protein